MKKHILFVMLALFTNSLLGEIAPPMPYSVYQPDGYEIKVKMYGDEHGKWIQTLDGNVIVDRPDNNNNIWWYYARLDHNNNLTPTGNVVGKDAPTGFVDPVLLRQSFINNEKKNGPANFDHNQSFQNNHFNTPGNNVVPPEPFFKPLVILVDFPALPSNMPEHKYTKQHFSRLFFEDGLSPLAGQPQLPATYTKSVYDYYKEISRGNFTLSGDESSIVDWQTTANPYSYYVDGCSGHGSYDIKKSAAAVLVEIAQKADEQVDFSAFDGNNDGVVDCVILIMEGWSDGSNSHFWSFQSMLNYFLVNAIDPGAPTDSDGDLLLDNTLVKNFIVTTEQFYFNMIDVQSGSVTPIGTLCHEMGHALNLPDLYDTGANSSAGIGEWGLMGSGNWNRQTSPAYMSAWSRNKMNWIEPELLSGLEQQNLSIAPAELSSSDPAAYKILINQNNINEYFLIENRQRIGSDMYLNGTGLLFWHIDENMTNMYPGYNQINVLESIFGVNLMQADNEGNLYIPEVNGSGANRGDAGDPFPGLYNNTSFTDQTSPAASSYNYDRDANGTLDGAEDSGIIIENISRAGTTVNATVTCPFNYGAIHQFEYDEGDCEGLFWKWGDNCVGILITPESDSYIRNVKTFCRNSGANIVKSINVRVYKGFNAGTNKPQTLLYDRKEELNWTADDRTFGWVSIPVKEDIKCEQNTDYYIEVEYNGDGGIIPSDIGFYSGSSSSGRSFWRYRKTYNCDEFTDGDWNIKAALEEILSPNIGELSLTTPPVIRIGDNIAGDVSFVVRNTGKARADSFSAALYLSADSLIAGDDLFLANSRKTITKIEPGDSVACTYSQEISVPESVNPGNYYIGVLADGFGSVIEDDETDNYVSNPVAVNPANKPPVFTGPLPELKMNEDDSLICPLSDWFPFVEDLTDPDTSLLFSIKSGTLVTAVIANDTCLFTVPPDSFGLDSLQLQISDGEYADSATFAFTVLPINDPPVIAGLPETLHFKSDSSVVLHMEDYQQDIDSEILFWSFDTDHDTLLWSYDSSTTELMLKAPDYNGSALLFCTLTDDSLASDADTISVHFSPANKPPVFVDALPELKMNEDGSLIYPVNNWLPCVEDATDPDSSLLFTIKSGSLVTATITNDSCRFTVPPDSFGVDSLELRVCDGEFADSLKFAFFVLPVNDPPAIVNLPDSLGFKNDSTVVLTMNNYQQDIDSEILFWSFATSDENLHCDYDTTTAELKLGAPGFSGPALLICTLTDDSLASVSDTIKVKVSSPDAVDERGRTLPEKFCLYQNFPNPFNPVTTIKYDIAKESFVELLLYNVKGQLVRELVSENKKPGSYSIKWNAVNSPTGVYIYRIKAGDNIECRKLLLIK